MRGTRSTLIAAIAIGLLAGSGVVTVAQDADDGAVASGFTGTLAPVPLPSFPPGPSKAGYGPYRFTLDVSDPRLDGSRLNVYVASPDPAEPLDESEFEGRVYYIEGDEGGWTGDGGAVRSERARYGPLDLAFVVLTGRGIYQGLTAYLVMDGTDVTPDGVIPVHGVVVGTEALPQPEPAPSAVPQATIHVDLQHVDGLEGLTLVGSIYQADLFSTMVDERSYTATADMQVPPGVHLLVLLADARASTCQQVKASGPRCGPSQVPPDRWCQITLHLRPDDDLTIGISGIPRGDEGSHGCQVSGLLLRPLLLP